MLAKVLVSANELMDLKIFASNLKTLIMRRSVVGGDEKDGQKVYFFYFLFFYTTLFPYFAGC